MKVEINNVEAISLEDVAERLALAGAFRVAVDERIGEVAMEDGALVVPILYDEPMDCRVDGCRKRDEVCDITKVRNWLTEEDTQFFTFAKDEDGNDILLCFNN